MDHTLDINGEWTLVCFDLAGCFFENTLSPTGGSVVSGGGEG